MSKDKHTPKVSVIIPTYNRASYLKEAIESVLAQTYKDFELIIVDDGSTDNTEEVVRSFDDERIIYKKKQREGHPGKTRNVGLDLARGEYIAFLDDDDLWLPEKLEEQIKTMIKHPGFKASYTLFSITGEGEVRKIHTRPKQKIHQGTIFPDLIKDGRIVCTPSICIHKDVIKKVGKFAEIPELRSGQDYDLWLRIAKEFEFLCIPKHLVIVRFQPASISEGYFKEKWFVIYERVIKDANVPRHLKRRYLSNCYFIKGECGLLLQENGYRSNLLKSLFLYPFIPQRYLVLFFIILPKKLAKAWYTGLKQFQSKVSRVLRKIRL